MKLTKRNTCQGTPELVDYELAVAGISVTGKRHVDIPNFWALMETRELPMFSPKALYLGIRQTWINNKERQL